MTEQEKTKLQDFFNNKIHIMSLKHDPSTNQWDMKPMKGAKEELIKHFSAEQKECSGENEQP
ncbi:MAG: hypothetical protein FWG89_10670 [Treponema sp.]|nr:hypothetical protein [Treponema sp.]